MNQLSEFAANYDYAVEEGIAAGVFGIFFVVYFLVIFLSMALSMVSYVLHSLGLYTIAERRKIHHSWLAWVPVGNLWMLGSISDQYQYVAKGKITNRRKIMLGISIGVIVVYIAWFVSMIVSLVQEIASGEMVEGTGMIVGMILGMLLIFVIAIVQCVFQYLSYYDLFTSANPNNGVLFLVLSIIFPVTLPFFVFACRKKDEGMPPKKQAPAQLVQEQPVAPVVTVVESEPVVEEAPAAEEVPAEAVPAEAAPVEETEAKPENEE